MRQILDLISLGNNLPTYLRSQNHIGVTMNTTAAESIQHQEKIAALPVVENRVTPETAQTIAEAGKRDRQNFWGNSLRASMILRQNPKRGINLHVLIGPPRQRKERHS